MSDQIPDAHHAEARFRADYDKVFEHQGPNLGEPVVTLTQHQVHLLTRAVEARSLRLVANYLLHLRYFELAEDVSYQADNT